MKARDLVDQFRKLVSTELEDDSARVVELAAGVEVEVECAKSGTFTDMHGTTVALTPDVLVEMAALLNPEQVPIKIGHVPITTETPDYGSVQAMRYDAAADVLLAKIVPSPALVRKNREEGFRRTSLELTGPSLKGPWTPGALAFLAIRKPAIAGLKPVELAAKAGEKVFVFEAAAGGADFELYLSEKKAAGTEPPKRLDTGGKVDLDARTEEEKIQMAENEKIAADLAAANADREKQKAENDRLRKQLTDGARDRVQSFLAAHNVKIPMNLRKLGLEEGLVALLAAEVSPEPIVLKFAVSEGEGKTPKSMEQTPSAFIFAMLAALPPQVSTEETKETVKKGEEDDKAAVAADGLNKTVKFAKSERHEKVLVKLAEMRKTEPKTTYTQATEALGEEDIATA